MDRCGAFVVVAALKERFFSLHQNPIKSSGLFVLLQSLLSHSVCSDVSEGALAEVAVVSPFCLRHLSQIEKKDTGSLSFSFSHTVILPFLCYV